MRGIYKTYEVTCLYCGKIFIAHRSDKKVCSVDCGNKIYRGYTYYDKNRECLICGKSFIANRSDHLCCSAPCRQKNSINKKRAGIPKVKKNIIKEDDLLYKRVYNKSGYIPLKEVEDFIFSMYRKRWWADHADIFQLINIHSNIFSIRRVPDNIKDYELYFGKMMKQIIVWYKGNKKDRLFHNNLS